MWSALLCTTLLPWLDLSGEPLPLICSLCYWSLSAMEETAIYSTDAALKTSFLISLSHLPPHLFCNIIWNHFSLWLDPRLFIHLCLFHSLKVAGSLVMIFRSCLQVHRLSSFLIFKSMFWIPSQGEFDYIVYLFFPHLSFRKTINSFGC